ncbi:MAG: hypothetical protein VW715_02320 [Rhodospirillales bacterium]|jgi:hypothetical protein
MNDLSFLKHLRAWCDREFNGNVFQNEGVQALLFLAFLTLAYSMVD